MGIVGILSPFLNQIMVESISNIWSIFGIPITGVIMYIFGGKITRLLDNKKKVEEIKISSASALDGMQHAYDKYVADDTKRRTKEEAKIEKLEKQCTDLQEAFNSINIKFADLYLQYSHEIQKNIDWAVMYNELKQKYETLESQYVKLKKDFEAYKKENK